ncbi:MAG: SDR family NAD(P)-dependent oxidoreductase [Verrucomicrobia bacterium]|nr:SDR family NAD(P)-dependent oxidoreductase [Verrucomicrobiota bacterium]
MPGPLPSMKGKVVLITGATRGIGRAGAEAMAALGAELILIGRDPKRLQEVRAACLAKGAPGIRTYQADLSLRKEVADLAHRVTAYEPSLDILWNNAGGWFAERILTSEGYERTWAMNHLAYFDLTQLLFPLLEKSDDPRVLCTASEAHRWGKMKWDNLQGEKKWDGWRAYCHSKLANLLYVAEQGRNLGDSKIRICAVHPGLVNSAFGDENQGIRSRAFLWLKRNFGRTNQQGADTAVWLSARTERPRQGAYYSNRAEKIPSAGARSSEDARRLWQITEAGP